MPSTALSTFALAVALVAGGGAVAAPLEQGAEPPEKRTAELLKQVQAAPGKVPTVVFEKIAKKQDAESFAALRDAIRAVEGTNRLTAAFGALRHYRGVARLEARALALLETACDDAQKSARYAAVYALQRFGEPALPVLGRLLARSRHPEVRTRALKSVLPVLREKGDARSLQLVLDNFQSNTSGRLETLTEAIPSFRGPRVVAALRSMLRDENRKPKLRVAVVEGLEEYDGKVDRLLVELLKAKSASVVTASIVALSVREYHGHTAELRNLARSKDPDLRLSALVGLAKMSGDSAVWDKRLAKDARDKSAAVRMRTASALGFLGTEGALETLHDLLEDEHEKVKLTALKQVLRLRRRASVPIVIERLKVEEKPVDVELYRALVLLTGLDHGKSGGRWSSWWTKEGVAFTVPELDVAMAADKARRRAAWEREERYTFFGLSVDGGNVCFVLDASGSMKQKNDIDVSRLDIAKRQLTGVLRRLPEGDAFDVIFFGSRVEPWREELVPMDAKYRAEVLEHVEKQGFLGGTALYDALAVAFELEQLEIIYVLSDGAPSGGTVNDVNKIRAEVAEWNADRHVVIHCIAVGGGHRLLEWLAEDSGGNYVRVK
ncbi:MAG: VWA domain-containing protein [Planctomycetota bacterium]|nr:MAG: VWA domain-containing protein [Planctomycetota bacterium]